MALLNKIQTQPEGIRVESILRIRQVLGDINHTERHDIVVAKMCLISDIENVATVMSTNKCRVTPIPETAGGDLPLSKYRVLYLKCILRNAVQRDVERMRVTNMSRKGVIGGEMLE